MLPIEQATAVILAGGFGTRLKAIVPDRPKVLAEVCGRPFITFLLDQLLDAGITKTVLCTGYKHNKVVRTLGDTYQQMQLSYSREHEPLGTAGALRLALPCCHSDPVLVMNGDSYCEANLGFFWRSHFQKNAAATVLLNRISQSGRYGKIELDENGKLLAFREKTAGDGPAWINAGIYIISRDLIRSIPNDQAVSLEVDVFPGWIGSPIYGSQNQGCFIDIGTPESFAAAKSFFKKGQ